MRRLFLGSPPNGRHVSNEYRGSRQQTRYYRRTRHDRRRRGRRAFIGVRRYRNAKLRRHLFSQIIRSYHVNYIMSRPNRPANARRHGGSPKVAHHYLLPLRMVNRGTIDRRGTLQRYRDGGTRDYLSRTPTTNPRGFLTSHSPILG